MQFDYNLPVNLVFGRGRVAKVGVIAGGYGKKALIVTGTGSTKRSGLLDRVISELCLVGLDCAVYAGVTQNPLTTTVEQGTAFLRNEGCDMVIGLGGGSVLDCAKAIAFLSANSGDLNDYIFNKLEGNYALPLILIPTTCGTGSEGNNFAVLTNPETGDKKSLRSPAIIAKASIIDSELMETMPKQILASVGFDALCHCMEAYLAKNSQPLSDAMCLQGIELVGKYLLPVYSGTATDAGWDGLALASTLGGMAIHTAGVTLPHAMEHPASGLKNIVHGSGLAALTPVIAAASLSAAPRKYAEIAKRLGGRRAEDCPALLTRLQQQLHLPITLSEQGIEAADIPWMTENCFKVSLAAIRNHPAEFTADEISRMYEQALNISVLTGS